jgi:Asp-tRNA(Asn)/Glu-tRNA(Gln) amidotransferase A subunit family amidase
MTLAWTQDTVGPLCRSAEDCAVVFDTIYGPDGNDNSVLDVPFSWNAAADVRQLRVGYLRAAFEGRARETARQLATRRNNEQALNVIRSLGVQLVPFDLPQVEIAAIDFIRWAETAAAFDEPTRSGTLANPGRPEQSARPADIRAGRFIPAVEYIQANRYRLRIMKQVDDAMAGLDMFLGANNLLTNRLGLPILTVPSGFFESSPTALHMTGKLFGEPELFLLAHVFQSRTDHHLKQPSETAQVCKRIQGDTTADEPMNVDADCKPEKFATLDLLAFFCDVKAASGRFSPFTCRPLATGTQPASGWRSPRPPWPE